MNAIFTSLLASCRMHGVEPWTYLRDLFCVLPHCPPHRLIELAPLNWRETLARPEVQELLGSNRFRRLTLDRGASTTPIEAASPPTT